MYKAKNYKNENKQRNKAKAYKQNHNLNDKPNGIHFVILSHSLSQFMNCD